MSIQHREQININNEPRTTDEIDFILEKSKFHAILASKRVESVVYPNPRTARRLKWTD